MKSLRQLEGRSGVLSYGLYKLFKKQFKGPDKKAEENVSYHVSYHVWSRICTKFNKRIMNSIMEGYIFKLPYRLGSLGLIQQERKIRFNTDGSIRTDNLGVDWDKTLILWRKLYPEITKRSDYKQIKDKPIVFYTNEHTDGRVMRFYWKKKYSTLPNKSVYAFCPTQQHKTKLTEMIRRNPNKQYCEKF
jgi:hypothetical protein